MIQPTRKKVRLIHTSDTHLGDGMGHPRSETALRAVVEAVPRLGGDALLLVGDVFDNGRIPDSVHVLIMSMPFSWPYSAASMVKVSMKASPVVSS